MYLDMALCLPRDAATVGVIRAAVTTTLRQLGVHDDCVEDIRLALSEACTNVIVHAAPHDQYEVQVQLDEQTCTISVINTGAGFDASALSGVLPDAESVTGRGVAIMRAVTDSLEFTSSPRSGTVVRMVKELSFTQDGPFARLRRANRD